MTRKGEIKQHQDTPGSFSQRISFAMARHKTLEDIFVVPKRSNIYFVTVLLSGVFPDKRHNGVPWTQDDTDRRKLHGKPYSMFTMGFGFWVLLHPAATSSSQFEWGSQFRKEPQQ